MEKQRGTKEALHLFSSLWKGHSRDGVLAALGKLPLSVLNLVTDERLLQLEHYANTRSSLLAASS